MNHAFELYSNFSKRKQSKLKQLENEMLNYLMQDFSQHFLELTILSYVLGKILSKPRYFIPENKTNIKEIEDKLLYLSKLKPDSQQFEGTLSEIQGIIIKLESSDPRYIFDLFTKAKIKTAATLYAKGVSLGKVSNLVGIPKQEIQDYSGKTMMFDRLKSEMSMKERVSLARKFLTGE